MAFPVTTLPPAILADALSNNEGNPSPMLSIRDLPVSVVNKYVEKTNSHLPDDRKIAICLINGPRGVVVVGAPGSLHGLNLSLRKLKAPQGLEQGRVPHSERKLRFTNRFLTISCPFHSKYLESVAPTIIADLEGLKITSEELAFPVYATDTGKNLQDLPAGTNIVPLLVEMITHLPVHWELATQFSSATHIIDFGPGGVSGLGSVTHRNKDGTGVRVIIAGSLEAGGGIGGQGEVFERGEGGVRYNVDWVEQYRPRLIKVLNSIEHSNYADKRPHLCLDEIFSAHRKATSYGCGNDSLYRSSFFRHCCNECRLPDRTRWWRILRSSYDGSSCAGDCCKDQTWRRCLHQRYLYQSSSIQLADGSRQVSPCFRCWS